jgi:cytidyltransferase-like protein
MRYGIKMGAFTLLMPHHVETLRRCKEHCDELIVLINNDAYIQKKKGCVPLNAYERRNILLTIKYVDSVVIVGDPDMEQFVEQLYNRTIALKPDNDIIIFHSHELEKAATSLPGAKWAAEIMVINELGGPSVSHVFNRIRYADI